MPRQGRDHDMGRADGPPWCISSDRMHPMAFLKNWGEPPQFFTPKNWGAPQFWGRKIGELPIKIGVRKSKSGEKLEKVTLLISRVDDINV